MNSYPSEPAVLRAARVTATVLPKGRGAFVRKLARMTGNTAPFFAQVGENQFLIDLNERVSRTLYLYRTFEPAISALLPKLIKPGDVVADAGANFGYFTVLAARAAGPGGKIFAFEPDPRNIERLQAVIDANGAKQVELVKVGLFDRVGPVTFNLGNEAEDNLGSSSIIEKGNGRAQIEIQVTTLDEFARERGVDRIDLMKMDIEGAEVEALAGASKFLGEHRIRQILVEMHVFVVGRQKALDLAGRILSHGYHGYYIHEEGANSGQAGSFLRPLAGSGWEDRPNPHCLFTVEPVEGVGEGRG